MLINQNSLQLKNYYNKNVNELEAIIENDNRDLWINIYSSFSFLNKLEKKHPTIKNVLEDNVNFDIINELIAIYQSPLSNRDEKLDASKDLFMIGVFFEKNVDLAIHLARKKPEFLTILNNVTDFNMLFTKRNFVVNLFVMNTTESLNLLNAKKKKNILKDIINDFKDTLNPRNILDTQYFFQDKF